MWLQPSVSMKSRMFQIRCFDTKHYTVWYTLLIYWTFFFFKEKKVLTEVCSRNEHSKVPRKPKILSTPFPFFFPHFLSQRHQFSMASCFSRCYRNVWFQCFQSFKTQHYCPFLFLKERILILVTAQYTSHNVLAHFMKLFSKYLIL